VRIIGCTVAILSLCGSTQAEVSVTVYKQYLGLVSEHQSFKVGSGMQSLMLSDVAAFIEPTSVRIQFADSDVELYEQNFHYDLVNTQAILNRYLDRSVRLVGHDGAVHEGTLLASTGMYVLQSSDGLTMVNPEEILHVDLAELPDGFYTRPTLEWQIHSPKSGSLDAEVSYLTRSINWHAEYVAHLNSDDSRIQWSGWASIDNRSGATYKNARLKLIAGDIHRPTPDRARPSGAEYALAAPARATRAGFDTRSFFEYQMYDLPRRTTISDKETKQIALFEPATASVDKMFLYRPYRNQNRVAVVVEFENEKSNGLGMAMPKGLVRLTKSDVDGTTQLLGEDKIEHTPRGERISLEVGHAFDVVPEYRVVDRRQISKTVQETDVEITLRNHKESEVEVVIEQKASRWNVWKITKSSQSFLKVDAETFTFKLKLPRDGEAVCTYTLRTGA
jgi:hypothetical protein